MLKIRLQRVGRKNDPSFRIVVTESTNAAKKSGRFAEVLGSYDARHGEPQIKADRVKHWIGMGAQVSDTVHNLLIKQGVIEGKAKNPLPKKTAIKKPAEPVEKKPVAEVEEKAPEAEAEIPAETPEEPKTEEPVA
ncbi:MAG: 30S ribosomal protein S16 [Candidatus Vogelbacteria bacterium GWA1_51_14]|uniref:Small ribosomal subunit protein bS16 n=1 Tax=Candidatus Vogelbacteria bacterium GWA1_51_14 TaxID=1802435 RepID=A0A1G2Q9Q9_9BACT|nr:MAG: 30S ribosomal protein S16 [Candidatus Vogelbacteria bacterium GWA1_51_14]